VVTVSAFGFLFTQLETGFTRTPPPARRAISLGELPVGHYRVQADAKGFQKFQQEGIILR
jgi:hypothetical protein